MPHTYHEVFESSAATVGLITAALIYGRGWLRVRRLNSNTLGAWRVLSFLLGLLLIWTAVGSPVAGFDHKLLTAHMIKHLLLMTLAPPLIFLGDPSTTLWLGLPRRIRLLLDSLFHSSPAQQLARTLTHPAVCWLGATGTLVVWHIPDVFTLGLQSEMWHGIEQASFFGTGLLFWWPVVHPLSIAGKWSQWSILLYLFLGTLPCDILSGLLVFCDRVIYSVFLSSPQSFGLSGLEDQQCAGALMWTCVTVVYMIAGTLITARLLLRQRSPEWPVEKSCLSDVSTATATRQGVEVAWWRAAGGARKSFTKKPIRHSFVTEPDPTGHGPRLSSFTLLSDYCALTKPDVNFLILITTFVGFYLGCGAGGRSFPLAKLFNTLLGTLLVASGTGTLNQYIERKFDAQMRRTARRPAAAGRLQPSTVLAFGVGLAAVGNLYLAATVNLVASMLAVLALLTYLFVYTPLKRKTPFCVLVGAFSGAMPTLIGWAAASRRLNMEIGILYAILFLWQFPHFMAIAWMYREDYDRAGYLMLPKKHGRRFCVILQTILPLFGLISLCFIQLPPRHAVGSCCTGVLLGLGFLYFGLEFALELSRVAARRLLVASIAYLPLSFILRATLCRPS